MSTEKETFRYLVVAMVTAYHNPINDSGFYIAMYIARKLAQNGNYVYLCLPEQFDRPEVREELEDVKGIKYITTGISTLIYSQAHSVVDTQTLSSLFSMYEGRYFIDAAIVFSSEHAIQLRSVISHHGLDLAQLPVYSYELGMNAPDTNPAYVGRTYNEMLHALGFGVTIPCMATSREISVMEDKMLMYGAGASLRNAAKDNAMLVAMPIDFTMINRIAKEYPRDPKEENPHLGLLYAARMNSVKRVDKIIAAYDECYREGLDCHVTMMSNTPEFKCAQFTTTNNILTERDYIKTRYNANRETFYRAAAQHHIYTMWSTSEVYPLALVEAVLLGCIPQVQTSAWATNALTDWDDPLFWFEDEKTLVTNIRWIQANWQEARKRAAKLIQKILPFLKNNEVTDRIMADMQSKYDNGYWFPHTQFGMKKEFDQMLQRAEAQGMSLSPLYIADFFSDFLRSKLPKESKVRANSNRLPMDYHFYYWLKYMYKMKDNTSRSTAKFKITLGDNHGTESK